MNKTPASKISSKIIKILSFITALIMIFTACGNVNSSNGTFLNIDDADLPDILEITVGTSAETFFSSGLTDTDYQAVFVVTFRDTTEKDYTILMEHYQSGSTGTDKDGFLLFDWGRLLVTTDDNSITVNAYIS